MENQTDKFKFIDKVDNQYPEVLTSDAISFLIALHQKFNDERLALLEKRKEEQLKFDQGEKPTFLDDTAWLRHTVWLAAKIPEDLKDRRVEITGPVDRKMIINALNSGANAFMADFEDSNSPTWDNVMQGQANLMDAVRRKIDYRDSISGKEYKLKDKTATLMVRPRGWHLPEKHILIDGTPISGALVDFGLYFFHNAKELLKNGTGPYFYLPKLEHYLEARLWNEVFNFAQSYLSIPEGTIKSTVLIETITATFQLDEIIYELQDHIAGLNCGRWDYIFSYVKKFRKSGLVTPNRSDITMQTPFMKAYSLRVIQVCHKRGIHAMGGMAAQIPIKNDPEANQKAIEKVRDDKKNEVLNGHDGTWVAHPGLVTVAKEVFDKDMPEHQNVNYRHFPRVNQIDKKLNMEITTEQLLEHPEGVINESGVRLNINVGILYLISWLNGNGAAALYHLMEDAATAEISRSQLWQWLNASAKLEDGRIFNLELYNQFVKEELEKISAYLEKLRVSDKNLKIATDLFNDLITSPDFEEFLTLKAYKYL